MAVISYELFYWKNGTIKFCSDSEEGGSDISATKKYFIMPLNLWL